MATVLVTGAAGAIGSCVVPVLKAAGHDVRGFDRAAGESVTHRGELVEQEAVDAAVEGVETVIHLAARPSSGDFETELVPPNVVGLFRVLDACGRLNVAKVALASSARVVAGAREEPVGIDMVAPEDLYGLTKLWAENMGEMYARRHEMAVLAVRIGWFTRGRETLKHIKKMHGESMYFSPGDAGRFFLAAVERPFNGFHIVYAASGSSRSRCRFDLNPTKKLLGFEPQEWFPKLD